LSEYVLEQLGVVLKGDFVKPVAQTNDGTAVMSGEKGGVQTVIEETYKKCSFYSLLCTSVEFNNRKRGITKSRSAFFQ
jgi:hypothetical protein